MYIVAGNEFCKVYKKENKIYKILLMSLECPNVLGPYYKTNWLLSKDYQRKLIQLRKDQNFLSKIPETENINVILSRLRVLLNKKRQKKEKMKKQSIWVAPKIGI